MNNSESAGLLARLCANGESALAEYFARHRERLRRMVHRRMDRRLARRVDASDILQEGYVDAARRLDEYLTEPSMPFVLWLRFLLHQRVLAAYRWHFCGQKRDARREDSHYCAANRDDASRAANARFAANGPTPSGAAVQAETREQLRRQINQLDPLDREIILLRHVDELSNTEAAQMLALSPSAASKRYIRALDRLRQLAQLEAC